jgi:aspartate kinase
MPRFWRHEMWRRALMQIHLAREEGMSEVLLGAEADAPIAVIKIGGSILTSASAYRRAALFVSRLERERPEERLVIVVSAQEGATDSLERTARKIAREPDTAALDLLWSTGELRSVALLALHLQALGVAAAAVNVHQAGLHAPEGDRETGRVRVNARRLRSVLARRRIVIVPGFFAVDAADGVVSLGRGGSDLTAVLLAEGLDACRCELMKDVPGYFSADPHRDPAARHLPNLTFEEALALADAGCDLVQRKAIAAAERCGMPLVIRSVDESAPFTWIAGARSPGASRWESEAEPAGAAR